jgi:glutamate--cysteine ligase
MFGKDRSAVMSIPQSGGGPIERHEQMAEYLEAGCKPPEDWRIGTEHEKFGYCKDTLMPLPYDGPRSIRAMLEGLRDRHGWAEVTEGGNLIGLVKDGANVSLEPGGQLELSGAPLETIHQTCDEVNQHLAEVKDIADEIGAGFIGLGAAPVWSHDDMPLMPKGRYKLMDGYMQKVGTAGTTMMRRTCTVQVNLDFSSEVDMVQKMRVSLALQPVATALFANSPFFEGQPNGHKSWRSRVWRHLDDARTGMLPFVFDEGFGFEAWVQYVLDVPMYFVYRDGQYINALGMSFRDFLKGELPALPGETPTLSDWADHLTTVFPEARVKKFIEMRGADGGPWRRLCALPAFWVGLMYDQTALDAAWDLVKGWDAETREALRVAASVDGLQAQVNGLSMHDLAREAVAMSEAGLKARARPGAGGMVPDETHFLNALKESVESGKVPADELLDDYNGAWHGDLSRIYGDYSY